MKKLFMFFFAFLCTVFIYAIDAKDLCGKWKWDNPNGRNYFQYEFFEDGTFVWGLHVKNGPDRNGEYNGWAIYGNYELSNSKITFKINRTYKAPWEEGDVIEGELKDFRDKTATIVLDDVGTRKYTLQDTDYVYKPTYSSCTLCHGSGNILCYLCKGARILNNERCFKCGGTGYVECLNCNGHGKIEH